MNFANAMSLRINAAQVPAFVEYPKWVHHEGKDVLLLTAEDEEALRSVSKVDASTLQSWEGEHVPRGQEAPDDFMSSGEEQPDPANLLNQPEKRGRGRPRLVRAETADPSI